MLFLEWELFGHFDPPPGDPQNLTGARKRLSLEVQGLIFDTWRLILDVQRLILEVWRLMFDVRRLIFHIFPCQKSSFGY